MFLGTARLMLAPVSDADLDDLFYLDTDSSVMRFVNGGLPTPRRDVADWVIPRAQAEYEAYGTGLWTIRRRAGGVFVGWVSLRTPRHSNQRELELSYRLRSDGWGRGIATEATRAVVGMSFEHLATQRIFASTLAANTASRRVMQKLGMRLSAIHISDEQILSGFERDEVEYELMSEQWFNRGPRHSSEPVTHRTSWPPKHARHTA
ncbi:GNAT family N-acetyltransferase [Gordonia sp. TBRC 11910]|uniref:GNAT family N-acetyltransferase n=1 Tax=Gordonia asplenii TaxID=2725283 RepID=A0A848KQX4_9ACTN|nr:GNAT family N-acetyltransferase [Gordonia asplenii]NMO00327.1 GNAT family N-acetyltransferase [Gordonia asplenii]